VTFFPAKLSRVMPVKVEMAPQLGEERKVWMVSTDGNVSETWTSSDESSRMIFDSSSLFWPADCDGVPSESG